jgi:hypothetical protein
MGFCLARGCRSTSDRLVASRLTRSVEARCERHAPAEEDGYVWFPLGSDGLGPRTDEKYRSEARGYHVRSTETEGAF